MNRKHAGHSIAILLIIALMTACLQERNPVRSALAAEDTDLISGMISEEYADEADDVSVTEEEEEQGEETADEAGELSNTEDDTAGRNSPDTEAEGEEAGGEVLEKESLEEEAVSLKNSLREEMESEEEEEAGQKDTLQEARDGDAEDTDTVLDEKSGTETEGGTDEDPDPAAKEEAGEDSGREDTEDPDAEDAPGTESDGDETEDTREDTADEQEEAEQQEYHEEDPFSEAPSAERTAEDNGVEVDEEADGEEAALKLQSKRLMKTMAAGDDDTDTTDTSEEESTDGGEETSSDGGPYADFAETGYTTTEGPVKHVNWESPELRNKDSANYLFLAREWSSYFTLVDYFHPVTGTGQVEHASSAYSFTITPNSKSTIEWWTQQESGSVIVHEMTSLAHELDVECWQALGIVLEDDALSGKCGVWIKNAGTYQGSTIDVRITFQFHSFTAETEYQSGTEGTIWPIVMVSLRKDGMLGIDTEDLGLELDFELYRNENGTEVPVSLNMSLNIGDIDGNQTYGFRVLDGDASYKAYVVRADEGDNQVVLQEGCRVNARPEIRSTDKPEKVAAFKKYMSEEDYNKCKDYRWLIAMYNINYDEEPCIEGEVRFELTNTHSFSIIYGSWMEYCYQGLRDNRGLVNEKGVGGTDCFGDSCRRYELVKEMVQAGAFSRDELEKYQTGNGSNLYRANLSYFTSYAFLPYDLPTPVKTVSDKDETAVTSNTLTSIDEEFSYQISQFVPLERPEYYYESFEVVDTLPDGLEYAGLSVSTSAENKDVSSWFEVQQDGQTLTIRAKDSTLAKLKDETGTDEKNGNIRTIFRYNATYTFTIRVKLSGKVRMSEGTFSFRNTAFTRITRTIMGTKEELPSKETDPVTTTVTIHQPRIKITKTVDERYAPFGNPSFLFKITDDAEDSGEDGSRTYYVCITLKDGNTGSEEICVAGGETAVGRTYTVTELPVARYTLSDISPGACSGGGTVTVRDKTGADVTVHAATGDAAAEAESAEVIFTDTLSYWGKLSHTDAVVNSVKAAAADVQ